MSAAFDRLLKDIRACQICAEHLPHDPRPVIRARETARIVIAGQAPGTRVHASGIPFTDPSGDRLRDWMGVSSDEFYDVARVAIVPMGFCFPGTAKGGDLPPRPLCAETWRVKLLNELPHIALTLVIGQFAQSWHLPELEKQTLTMRVRNVTHDAEIIPLPHPSPRNGMWLKNNPWFEKDILPNLKRRMKLVLT